MPVASHSNRHLLTRRNFLLGAAATGIVGAYSYGPARHHLTLLRHDVYIPDLPPAFHGFTIAQLSDFHFGVWSEDSIVHHAVEMVNALNPKIVALTGDFVTANHTDNAMNLQSAAQCSSVLAGLRAPLRYATLGNHDMVDITGITQIVESHGIKVLHNEFLPVDLGGDRIWLAGLADALEDTPDLKKTIPAGKPHEPVIVLGHEPDFADIASQYCSENRLRADLYLAGHTHGGQINIPGLRRFALPGLGLKYVHGPFQIESTLLYVNRGLGTIHLPLRFNAPPEITLFTLHP